MCVVLRVNTVTDASYYNYISVTFGHRNGAAEELERNTHWGIASLSFPAVYFSSFCERFGLLSSFCSHNYIYPYLGNFDDNQMETKPGSLPFLDT